MAVRREKVILELDDRFSTKMAKAAGETMLLDKALNRLDGSAVKVERPLHQSAVETDRVAVAARRSSSEIDRYSGRLRLLADVAAILGPSLVPIGAVAIPAVTGLASQLGFAALGAGSLVTAFQGVGDALKAVNQAALEPTAANLEKAQAAMAQLGPDAQAFVTRFQELRPVLRDIRDSSAAGWFPGLTEAMDSFERIGPEVGDLFEKIGRVGGDLVAGGLKAFAGPEWADFRAFISAEAPKALDTLGRTVGNLIGGLARLWQAFAPLNSDFSSWMLNASRDFQAWADGLSQTEGFAEFVDYIRTNGPRVADALKAVGDAVLQIIEALAPLGGPSLKIIETFANAIAAIADSDLGTPIFGAVAALAMLNRTLQVTAALQTRLTGSTGLAGGLAAGGLLGGAKAGTAGVRGYLDALLAVPTAADRARMSTAKLAEVEAKRSATLRSGNALMGRSAALVGGLAIATTGLGDSMGVTNTASLTMMGSMAGPWGAAAGAAIGLTLDWTQANDGLQDSLKQATQAMDSGSVDQMTTALQRLRSEADALKDRGTTTGFGDFLDDATSLDTYKQRWSDMWAAVSGGTSDVEKAEKAIRELESANEIAFAAQQHLSDGFTQTAHAAGMTTQELYAMTSALDAQVDAALSAADADLQWRNTLAAAREQAASNSAGIRGMSEDARNNKGALLGLARAWNTQRDAMVENGASAAAVKRRHESAREAFVRVAVQMGVNAKEARDLAREYLKIPEKVKTSVVLEGAQAAKSTIAELKRQLAGIPKSVQTTYRVKRVGDIPGNSQGLTPSNPSLGNLLGGSADGGSVPKTGLPYADRHPYLLADGEEVISNRFGQADRHRGLLKAINANRLAEGGTTGLSTRSYTPDFGHGLDRAIRSLTVAVDDGTRSLKQRLKLANEERDSIKERLDLQRQERDALRDAIKDRLTSDIFAKSDVYQLDRPDLTGMSAAEQAKAQIAWIEMNEQLRRAQQSSPEDILRRDIAQGREFAQLTKTLKAKGLDGSALSALLSGGDMAQIEAYANGSRKDIATYERLFERRERVTQRAADAGGAAVFGKEIAELRKDYREQLAVTKRMEKHMTKAEKQRDEAPAKTGREVGKVIKSHVSDAVKGR